MRRLLILFVGWAEMPSRVRLLEGEVADLRRQVGAHARLLDTFGQRLDGLVMESRMRRGLDETHAVLGGNPTTQTTRLPGADTADAAAPAGGAE